MDYKDKELENALDEIFGDDIIELDTSTPLKKTSNLQNITFDANKSEENIENLELEETLTEEQENIEKIDTKDDKEPNSNVDFEKQESSLKEKKEISNIPMKKVVIISALVVLLTLAIVYLIVNYFENKQKTINCSFSFDDKGYKITDEYKITYKNKLITYIEGVYIYTSKTDDFDEQIKYIKEDKLPAIINSNGMKGFTYSYENSDDLIKINSYLDYTIMDFEKIKNIDQTSNPISYFKINLEDNSKNLISLLEKQGYKCTTSK